MTVARNSFPTFFCDPSHPIQRSHQACRFSQDPVKSTFSSINLLHSVQHDLEQIADHVIIVKVQHEKAAFDLQSAVLVDKATVRLSYKLQHCNEGSGTAASLRIMHHAVPFAVDGDIWQMVQETDRFCFLSLEC